MRTIFSSLLSRARLSRKRRHRARRHRARRQPSRRHLQHLYYLRLPRHRAPLLHPLLLYRPRRRTRRLRRRYRLCRHPGLYIYLRTHPGLFAGSASTIVMKLKTASAGTVGRNPTTIKLYELEMKKSLKIQLLFILSKSNLPAVLCPPHGRQYIYLPVFLSQYFAHHSAGSTFVFGT